MPICVKCNTSIKPAALETKVKGESYHPTCVSCAICDRKLWGKPFKRVNGKLQCEETCQPAVKRPGTVTLGPASSRLPDSLRSPFDNHEKLESLQNFKPSIEDEWSNEENKSKTMKTNDSNNISTKICKICFQSVFGKRFITYENGEIVCCECDAKNANKPQRVKSAHMIICSICNQTVRGTRYTTESDKSIICENCDLTGDRCYKCQLLFKYDEPNKKLSNGLKFHEKCFDCSSCGELILTNDFYTDDTGLQICLNCYNMSKYPICYFCKNPIYGPCIIINNNPIHKECFKCNECNVEINQEDNNYKNKNNSLICYKCFIKQTGTKCNSCMEVIERDGVTFADKDYHQHCYKCDKCNVQLIRMKKTLTDREGQSLFCEPCFVKNFSPKCNKCKELIMPYRPGCIFEENNFHRECFACARCRKTLADKKFFKAGTIFICENCY